MYADWLQASAISVERSTMPSTTIALERRSTTSSTDFGYLRAVRPMSTVQGAFATLARRMAWGPATVSAGVGIFAGQASASADTSGYHYTVGGQTGYQSRFTHSEGASFGAGLQLTVTMPLSATSEFRASAAEWGFGGDPVQGDNMRFLAGVGLSLRLPKTLMGAKSARGNN
jgi:hypothetical protein